MARLSAGLPLSFGGCAFFPGTENLRVAVNARDAASDAKSTSSPRSAYSIQRGPIRAFTATASRKLCGVYLSAGLLASSPVLFQDGSRTPAI